MLDFRTIYYNARVLLVHQDPYNTLNGEQIARNEGEKPKAGPFSVPSEITCVYPPSALLVNAPLGFMGWGPSHRIWMALNGGGLIVAAFLMWDIGAMYAPLLSGILCGFLLANSEGLLFQGNVAGIVVSLCIIAAWSFLRERYALIGVLCMAVSLSIKPHDSGLVWLYFLLIGASYRKRALQALFVTCVLGAVSIVWISRVAPDWTHELRANLAAVSSRGAGNDPGPASGSRTIISSDINLQAVISVLWDEPRFYDPVSYALCGLLLIPWVILTMRSPMSPRRTLIALAFVSALSMLPVYHRHHDGKLLLLAIPGCALLWAKGRFKNRIAVVLTCVSIILNADVPRAVVASLESGFTFSAKTTSGKVMMILLVRPVPLVMMAMAVSFLWSYWRTESQECTGTSLVPGDMTLQTGV